MDERKINIIDDETETLIVIQTSVLSHAKRRIDIYKFHKCSSQSCL